MKLIKYLFLLLGLTCIAGAVQLYANDFESGIDAYHKSQYVEAVTAFERALRSDKSAAAHHNLALTYFQLGEAAKAVWQLEQAVRLDPLNESYLFKLGTLRQQLGLYELPAKWWQSAARALPQSTWIWVVSMSAWLLLAAIVLLRISGRNRPIILKILMSLAVVGILLAIAALDILTTQQASGVIVSEDATIMHHAPASGAPESGLARPGERARLLDKHRDYLRIKTEAGITGWVSADALGVL